MVTNLICTTVSGFRIARKSVAVESCSDSFVISFFYYYNVAIRCQECQYV